MRGKADIRPLTKREHRITPAYAGKSFAGNNQLVVSEDHPRLCGEKTLPAASNRIARGSPPPMRGKAQMSP